MDPNNNIPTGTTPFTQPVPQPVSPMQPGPPAQSPMPTFSPAPKGKMNKTIILLVILLLLVSGMVGYILFTKNQMDNAQKATITNTNYVAPSPSPTPTLAPKDNLEVSSPEADLKQLDTDVKGL